MPTCADIYIVGGLVATIVIFCTRYNEQEIEEIVQGWKTRRAK